MDMNKRCKDCGHALSDHIDEWGGEIGACCHTSNHHYGESQGEDYCNCEHFKGDKYD